MSDIKDIRLAPAGRQKIEWVKRYMPVLRSFEEEFAPQKPFDGYKMCVCCHLEAKTAYLIQVIQACGAQVAACASNPLSTQDDVVAALVDGGADVYAIHGETIGQYEGHIRSVLETEPNLIVDDGGDVITMLHKEFPQLVGKVIGASEESITAMERDSPCGTVSYAPQT